MDFTVRTSTEHHGATIYERWTFPKPEDRSEEDVLLEILDSEMGGGVISASRMPPNEVPDRAATKFLEGATAYKGRLVDLIDAVDTDEGPDWQPIESPALTLTIRSKKDNEHVQLNDGND